MGKKPKRSFDTVFSYPPAVYAKDLRIATHENVSLEYKLAGPGSRFLALFVDKLLRVAVYAVIVIIWLLVTYFRLRNLPKISIESLRAFFPWIMAAYLALNFVRLLYHTVFEMITGGSSPGKKAFGVRVMRVTGEAPTAAQYLLRNVLRLIDLIPGGELLDGCVALFDKQYRRIGDLAAGTVVVRDRFGKRTDSAKTLDDLLNAAWEEPPAEETETPAAAEERLPVPGTDAFFSYAEFEMLQKYLALRRSFALADVYDERWARLICARRKVEMAEKVSRRMQLQIMKKAEEDLLVCYPEEMPEESHLEYYAPAGTEGKAGDD